MSKYLQIDCLIMTAQVLALFVLGIMLNSQGNSASYELGTFSDNPNINEMLTDWSLNPYVDFQIVTYPSDCPEGYEPAFNQTWNGLYTDAAEAANLNWMEGSNAKNQTQTMPSSTMGRVMCGKRGGTNYRDATLADPKTSGTNYGCPDGFTACSAGNPQSVCLPPDMDTSDCPVLNITWVTDMGQDTDQFITDQMNMYNRTVILNSFQPVIIDSAQYYQFFTFTKDIHSDPNLGVTSLTPVVYTSTVLDSPDHYGIPCMLMQGQVNPTDQIVVGMEVQYPICNSYIFSGNQYNEDARYYIAKVQNPANLLQIQTASGVMDTLQSQSNWTNEAYEQKLNYEYQYVFRNATIWQQGCEVDRPTIYSTIAYFKSADTTQEMWNTQLAQANMIMGIVALILSPVHLFEEATFKRKIRFALLGLLIVSCGMATLSGMSYNELKVSSETLETRLSDYTTLNYIKTCTQTGANQYQNMFDSSENVQLINDMNVDHAKTLALVSWILGMILGMFQGVMIFNKCRQPVDEEDGAPFLETNKPTDDGYGEIKRQTTIQGSSVIDTPDDA